MEILNGFTTDSGLLEFFDLRRHYTMSFSKYGSFQKLVFSLIAMSLFVCFNKG